MLEKGLKSLLVLAFSLFLTINSTSVFAQGKENTEPAKKEEGKLNIKEVIFGHVSDAHEFHFFSIHHTDGTETAVAIPLPVILYSPQNGFSFFMYSKFEEEKVVDGYQLDGEKIVAADGSDVYDFSLTRNVVQMMLALILLVWIMTSIAKKYKSGQGVTSAPKGMQAVMEPVIAFVRDEVAVPNLGYKANKYLPYLLTIFFFILINNIIGLIPGSANVTGNIAFTLVMGVISFIVTLFSSNKHYWTHIFNPPGVPLGVKFILVPVEFLSMFLKPFSLIIRLFANMIAGHIIIICLVSLIFIFADKMGTGAGWGASPLSLAFTIFIYFIEVLVAFLQAFIFAALTAVLIGSAVEGDHSHDAHDAHRHGHELPDDAVII
ncbi:MAG: F0F1 ATP synthase subunit A [Bacteroidetes bacterium]|nr:F0F1 ATP synthase subunit A [Bacteroidota bacterium]